MAHATTFELSPEQQALLPTDDELRAYAEHGFHIAPKIVPDEVLEAARRGQERFYAGDVDQPFPGRTQYDEYDWQPSYGDVLRKNDYASLMVDELAQLVSFPLIAATAARLAEADGIRLWHDQLLYKPSDPDTSTEAASAPLKGTNVGWHADRQYWSTCASETMLTAWVPLHDVDERMGTIVFMDGSHRWVDDVEGLDFFTDDFDAQSAKLAARPGARAVPATLQAGQVSFHHCKTIHGSGPNHSGRPRRSVAIHLQTADNHYVPGGYHRNDDLVRRDGDRPDYGDPRICPVLWR